MPVSLNMKINKDDLMKVIDERLDEVADFILTDSQQNIVNNGTTDEGTLLKSGNINRMFLHKQVIYDVPYADAIEFGRLPGTFPPVSSIKGWVIRKLGVKDEKESESIAWSIAYKIKKQGTEAQPFLTPAIQKARVRFK